MTTEGRSGSLAVRYVWKVEYAVTVSLDGGRVLRKEEGV